MKKLLKKIINWIKSLYAIDKFYTVAFILGIVSFLIDLIRFDASMLFDLLFIYIMMNELRWEAFLEWFKEDVEKFLKKE